MVSRNGLFFSVAPYVLKKPTCSAASSAARGGSFTVTTVIMAVTSMITPITPDAPVQPQFSVGNIPTMTRTRSAPTNVPITAKLMRHALRDVLWSKSWVSSGRSAP